MGVERGKMRGKRGVEKSQKKRQECVGSENGIPAGEGEKRHTRRERGEKLQQDEKRDFPRESSSQLEEEDEESESCMGGKKGRYRDGSWRQC